MLQLAMLEEVRAPGPPIRLSAIFFEPGSAAQAAELGSLGEVVVAVGAPLHEPLEDVPAATATRCSCGSASRRSNRAGRPAGSPSCSRACPPSDPAPTAVTTVRWGTAPTTTRPSSRRTPTGCSARFQGRRLPARRHPLGMQMRIEELRGDHVLDEGGELWHRRAEEIDAAACALGAHRYAVGHACWLGDPAEAVVVLPGSAVPEELPTQGVLPPVERLQLPPVTGSFAREAPDWSRCSEAGNGRDAQTRYGEGVQNPRARASARSASPPARATRISRRSGAPAHRRCGSGGRARAAPARARPGSLPRRWRSTS